MKTKIEAFHYTSRSLGISMLLAAGIFTLSAQDTLSNGKALNFPFPKYGISIGNSYEFSGLRVNFADYNVRRINGLNLTFWLKTFKNQDAVVNGISIGVIPTAGTMQLINIGILGVGSANCSNGLTIGGLLVGGDVNGISLSGLVTMADGPKGRITGLALSGLIIGSQTAIHGIAVGGMAIGTEGNINGLAASLAYIRSEGIVRGVAATAGYSDVSVFKGLSIAGYSRSDKMHGLSFALINKTKELHGVQLGLLNIAKNNPKGLRVFPFVNMHFKKEDKQ